MKFYVKYLIAVYCASLLGAVADGQERLRLVNEPEQKPTAPTECPRWKVCYLDSRLGPILGDAVVDWKNEVAVAKFPYAKQEFRLDSELILPPKNGEPRCQFRFKGAMPDGITTSRPDISNAQTLAAGNEAKVKVAREEDSFAFGVPSTADEATITVDLAVDDEGDMQGRWSYAADPLTQRDAKGGGRVAHFSMVPDGSFGGQQSGSELWLQLRPEIDYVVVLEDQLKIPHLISGRGDPSGNADRRTLFIVGRNLPVVSTSGGASYSAGKFESASTDTEYTYLGQPGDNLPKEDAVKIRRGWMAIAREIKDPAKRRDVLSRESALIKVKLKPDFVPGEREFTWAGAKMPWRLESCEARAQVHFVRQTGAATEWENVPEAYLPEDLAVELRLVAPIPYDSFKVKVRPFMPDDSGEGHAIGPEQEPVAQRISPLVYRTAALSLTRGDGTGIRMQPGAVLVAHATPNEGLLSYPASAEVKIRSSPGIQSPLWIEYILRVAKTQGVETTDLRNLATKKEDRISHTLILLAQRLHTDIYFGDHAAMLLLRDTFIDMAQRADPALGGAVGTDDGALGYAKLARATLCLDPNATIGKLHAGDDLKLAAGDLKGRTLAEAVDPDKLSDAFGDNLEARDKWVISAVRAAIAERRANLRQAVQLASPSAIGDDQLEKLLRLTGDSFDAVVAQAMPRLMMLNSSGKWVVDGVARGYVRELKQKFAELRDAQTTSDLDTRNFAILAVAATVGLGGPTAFLPTRLAQSAVVYSISAAGNGVLFLASSAAQLYATAQAKDEVAFALGAAPLIGDKRFNEAVLADPGWTKTLVLIGVSAGLTTWQVRADLRQVQATLQISRGARIAENTILSVYGVSKLVESEQRDLLAFLAHARSLRAQGTALTGIEMSAANALDRIGELAEKDPDALAKGLAMTTRVRQTQIAIAGRIEQSLSNNATKELMESLRLRRATVTDLWRAAEQDPRVLTKVTDFDLAWYSGAIMEADEARALELAKAHGLNWHDLKRAFMDGKVSPAEMHNFVTSRENLMKKLLDESIAEVAAAVERETGVKPNLIKKALGSTNLTSDLDYSAFGVGAERVVKVFNDKFRALPQFGGLESGHVFDTNVYTQAVYELFNRDLLVGKSLGIANADLDALRQLMYGQMATRKYIGSMAKWEKYKAALLGGAADDATHKMFTYTFEEAEYSFNAARKAIAKEMGAAGEDALHAAEGSNDLLRATNKAYEKVLGDIGQWRTEMTRLQQLMTRESDKLAAVPAEFLDRYPGWRAAWNELQKMERGEQFDSLAQTWIERLAYQLRKKQGEALFYASEAYQDEGTILHVVKDLQECQRGKLITFAKLSGGEGSRASKVLSQTDARGALNSMMENLANLRREHTDDAMEAAAKGGKYFIRVLDGGHEAGLDVVNIVGADLVKQTIGVDSLRASVPKVATFLQESGTSDAAYVKALEDAHEKLGVEMVKHKDITNLAARVRSLFDDVPGAAEASKKAAAVGERAP
jgi:hypothetical protein